MMHNYHTFHQAATHNIRMNTTPSKVIIPRLPGAPVRPNKKAHTHYVKKRNICYWCTKPIEDYEVTGAFSDTGIFTVHYGTCTAKAQDFLNVEFEENSKTTSGEGGEEIYELVWDADKSSSFTSFMAELESLIPVMEKES